jgi:hypothetical protein
MYAHFVPIASTKNQQQSNKPSKTKLRRQQRERAMLRSMQAEMDRAYEERIAEIVDSVYREMSDMAPEEWAALDSVYPKKV